MDAMHFLYALVDAVVHQMYPAQPVFTIALLAAALAAYPALKLRRRARAKAEPVAP